MSPPHLTVDGTVEPISSPTDRNAATMVAAAAAAAKKASIDCVPGSVRRVSGKFTPALALQWLVRTYWSDARAGRFHSS